MQYFNLAGGTSLSLQIGHRTSTDLVFFGDSGVDSDILLHNLQNHYEYHIAVNSPSIVIGYINGVNVDFVNYKYPLIDEVICKDDIRLLGLKDIACMKLSALAGRGKKRDFIDLYFLLQKYSLDQLFNWFESKYSDGNLYLVHKSLTYFTDAENDEMPKMLYDISWEEVKRTIIQHYRDFTRR